MSTSTKVLAWFLALFSLGLFVGSLLPLGLAWNVTASLPRGLYLTEKLASDATLSYGDIVCFPFVEPDWARGRKYVPAGLKICKPIVGMAGDSLVVTESELTIRPAQGAAITSIPVPALDSRGRALPPAIRSSGAVPKDHVFLISTYKPNSFDSRYLGPIPRITLTNKVSPLWVFTN